MLQILLEDYVYKVKDRNNYMNAICISQQYEAGDVHGGQRLRGSLFFWMVEGGLDIRIRCGIFLFDRRRNMGKQRESITRHGPMDPSVCPLNVRTKFPALIRSRLYTSLSKFLLGTY